jgi:geranylgeranyl pyrophosphate synthase
MIRHPFIIEECYAIASDYYSKACEALKALSPFATHKSLLDLAGYAIKRKK